jgi:hypothetical protein
MKKEIIHFTVERPKHRAHRVLFDNDSPFKPKTIKAKNQYRRKDKFQKRLEDLGT